MGERRGCFCLGRGPGFQDCVEDGRWSVCGCPEGDAGGGTDGPTSAVDGAPTDGAHADDAALRPDARLTADIGSTDASGIDAAEMDAATVLDAGDQRADAAPVARDSGALDAGFRDALPADLGHRDATVIDSGAPDAGRPDSGRPDAGTAACTVDAQCPSGLCHPVYRQCVPVGARSLCDTCTAESECGLPGDDCMVISAGAATLEQVCGRACNTNVDCPRGFTCQFGGQCYPKPGAIRDHTCHAVSDMLDREVCNPTGADTCGVPNFADGTCLVLFNVCTVGCDVQADCPTGSTCQVAVVGNFCIGL